MSKTTLFCHYDNQGKLIEYEVDNRDLENFKIMLLEASVTENLGDIFMWENSQWVLLDYFNL